MTKLEHIDRGKYINMKENPTQRKVCNSCKQCTFHDYRKPDASPVEFRLSIRLRSCSNANVSEDAEVEEGKGPAAVGGAEEECFFAATEEGTKDIIEVEGFLTEAGAPLKPALPGLTAGPPVLFFAL
jgi:hypothetical protein